MSNLIQDYVGEQVSGRYAGQGTYNVEGVGKYVGEFANGKFHGFGTLHVTNGKYEGEWEEGIMITGKFSFDDGLNYERRKWEYCNPNGDRRFHREIKENVPQMGPLLYDTANPNPPPLPVGCYDCIEGYMNPDDHGIYSYETKELIRNPDTEEVKWIVSNCRKHMSTS